MVFSFLARSGAQVIVAYRGVEDDFRHLRVMGEIGQINFLVSTLRQKKRTDSKYTSYITPIFVLSFQHFDLRDYESILKAMSHSNTVINLIGRNYSTR